MPHFLKKLYRHFLVFKKKHFFKDSFCQLGVEKLQPTKKDLSFFFDNYYKISFLEFLCDLKFIIFSKNVFDFILKKGSDNWDLWYYLEFLTKNKIIKVKNNGTPTLLEKEILNFLPKPKDEEEIKYSIEKKLKTKIKEKEPINFLFGRKKINAALDQLPISQGSAIFLVKKILERVPLFENFLFVGDDDLISLVLTIVEPKIHCLVADLDDELLSFIFNFSQKFKLKIEVEKRNILKKEKIKKYFVGFLTNPAYTEEGIKKFLDFGIYQLNQDGGVIFLEMGDEAIGNRLLFLQDFFAEKQLLLREAVLGKIYYPQILIHEEDRIISKRIKKITKANKEPRLGVTLFIFDFLPFPVKKKNFSKEIIAYL